MKSLLVAGFVFGSVISANAAANEYYLVIVGGSTAPGSTTGAAIATLTFKTKVGCESAQQIVKPISQVYIQTYCVEKK